MRFAERLLHGVGEDGVREEIVIWIERRPGAVWAVGRMINPKHRSAPHARPDDYPVRDDENFLKHTIVHLVDGEPQLSWEPVRMTKWEPQERKY